MANNEVTLRIGADAAKLNSGLNRAKAAVTSFSGMARASLSSVGKSIGNMQLGSMFAPLLIGGGLHYTVSAVGDLSKELLYYGMAAKKSDADTEVFRESLHDMAIQTGIDATTILGSVSKIGEITGDFKFSEEMGLTLAKTSLAANTSMEDLALLSSAINANVGWGMEQITRYFNSLIIQGDQGSFTLQKFASQGKALFSQAAAFGLKSEEQFAYFGAMLQTIAPSIKSEAEITTSVGALFRDLQDKQKDLGKKGIKIFDKVDGKNQVRDLKSIIDDIMKYVNGDAKKLAQIGLTSESMKVLNPLMADYQKGWVKMQAITDSGIKGMSTTDELENRYQRATRTFDKSMDKMKASAVKFADLNLAGPVETLSSALQTLSEHQTIVKTGFIAMTAAASLVGLVKAGQFVASGYESFRKFFPSKQVNESKPSNLIPFSPNDVQKVFVTNMRGGFGGGTDYMDDDVPMSRPATQKAAQAMDSTTKEVGRFRQGLSTARAGLNKFGSSVIGGTLMTAATGWAMNQIYNFGQAFMEWRNVVANSLEIGQNTINTNAKSFEQKYGSNISAKKYDETLKAIQEEENSFWPSQKKLDKLYKQLNVSRTLMAQDIASGTQRVTAQDYMQALNQNIVINVDSNGKTVVETDNGKPPKVQSRKNTPSWGA